MSQTLQHDVTFEMLHYSVIYMTDHVNRYYLSFKGLVDRNMK